MIVGLMNCKGEPYTASLLPPTKLAVRAHEEPRMIFKGFFGPVMDNRARKQQHL